MHHFLECFLLALVLVGSVSVVSAKRRSALLIIDVQDCFLPGGSLPVANGDQILPVINSIRNSSTFDLVVFSLDWHLPGHVSFASAHGKSVGDVLTLQYLTNGTLCLGGTVNPTSFPGALNCTASTTRTLEQTLWPDHCVQNISSGPTSSRISPVLTQSSGDLHVYKGIHKQIDSYSAFFDNGKFFSTNMHDELIQRKIDTVFVVGFALDICVFYSSMDAKALGYETYVVTDASLGIDPQHVMDAKQKLVDEGVKLINHTEIQNILESNSSSEFHTPSLTLVLASLLLRQSWLVFC